MLREDIIAAAAKILERTGSEDAVTLRAVAREVGIAAPSIDAHFAHRTEIIDAVVAKEAALLHQLLQGAAQSAEDPTGRLLAMCRTYVDYGRSRPASTPGRPRAGTPTSTPWSSGSPCTA